MLLGGITKTDQTDKILWLTMGISVVFQRMLEREKIAQPAREEVPPTGAGRGGIRRLPRAVSRGEHDPEL
jgi:hypothetical protein